MGRQLELHLPRRGGKRPRSGRKRRHPFKAQPHRARPVLKSRHPVLVTLRAAPDLPNLRDWRLSSALGLALRAAASRPPDTCKLRIVHFSIQADHLHLIVETADQHALGDGMRGLGVRLARAVNRELGRRGAFSLDRYHARALTTPTEVRHALVYVLNNWRKHTQANGPVDIHSSARWFDGWHRPPPHEPKPPPVHRARTWLLTTGWRRFGLIEPDEHPRSARAAAPGAPRQRTASAS